MRSFYFVAALAAAASGCHERNVANVVKVAVATRRFLSHLQHLAALMLRCGKKPLTPTLALLLRGKGAIRDRFDNQYIRCENEMGYILEEHFVTLCEVRR